MEYGRHRPAGIGPGSRIGYTLYSAAYQGRRANRQQRIRRRPYSVISPI
jgi:hypothetical protein